MMFDRKHYVLIGQTVAVEPDRLRWAQWFEKADRVVSQDYVDDVVFVSTVFLGLNHQFGDGPPLLFETMAWCDGEVVEGIFSRCSTWLEAEKQHREAREKAHEWRERAKRATVERRARRPT